MKTSLLLVMFVIGSVIVLIDYVQDKRIEIVIGYYFGKYTVSLLKSQIMKLEASCMH